MTSSQNTKFVYTILSVNDKRPYHATTGREMYVYIALYTCVYVSILKSVVWGTKTVESAEFKYPIAP